MNGNGGRKNFSVRTGKVGTNNMYFMAEQASPTIREQQRQLGGSFSSATSYLTSSFTASDILLACCSANQVLI